MASRRWLWPCSDAKLLRMPAYQDPPLRACLLHPDSPDDVLVSDSDDDLDDDRHDAKRCRIESIAHSFLAGQPIYISSARLRGPFPATKDRPPSREPFTSSAVKSTANPDSFIRRRHKRPTRYPNATPDPLTDPRPVFTPSKLSQSTSVRTSRPAQLQKLPGLGPRSANKDEKKTLKFEIPSSSAKPLPKDTSTTISLPSASATPQSAAGANSPDLDRDESQSTTIDETLADVAASPIPPLSAGASAFTVPSVALPAVPNSIHSRVGLSSEKAADVLEQRRVPSPLKRADDVSSPPLPKPPTNPHHGKPHKKRSTKRKYQAAVALDASSPFMYRKNASLAKATTGILNGNAVPHSDKATTVLVPGQTERHRFVSFDSSLDQPKSGSSQDPRSRATRIQSTEQLQIPETVLKDAPDSKATDILVSDPAHAPSSHSTDNPEPRLINATTSMLADPPCPAVQPTRSSSTPAQDLDVQQHEYAPAIDISFGQESLGMNFDLLDRYTNTVLPSSGNERYSISDRIRRAMRESGASLSCSPAPLCNDNVTAMSDTSKAEKDTAPESVLVNMSRDVEATDTTGIEADNFDTAQENQTGDGTSTELANGQADDGPAVNTNGEIQCPPSDMANLHTTEINDASEAEDLINDPVYDFPYVSTQAAMQDAHRALFDASSPENPIDDAVNPPYETPAKPQPDRLSSPVHTITPFHEFNADMAVDTQVPLPSTQALLDAYSPLKLSIKKPKSNKRASFAPSTIEEDANSGLNSALDTEESGAALGAEGLYSIQSKQTSPNSTRRDTLSAQENPRSLSNSPDVVFSQRSQSRMGSFKGPVFSQQSFRLSDIFESVSSQRGVDVNSLLAEKSHTPSSGKSGKKKKKRNLESDRSFQSKAVRDKKAGQRKSFRFSASQPQPEHEDEAEGESIEEAFPLSQPNLPTNGFNQSFASGSSTIPDPSLALNHFRQTATPTFIEDFQASTDNQKSTEMSSLQPAQRADGRFYDLDSTIEVLQRDVLQSWDVESAMRNPINASAR